MEAISISWDDFNYNRITTPLLSHPKLLCAHKIITHPYPISTVINVRKSQYVLPTR